MKLTIYHVDAFTTRLFHGNPAAVVPLEAWIPDDLMQAIAAENNLAETAFFVPRVASEGLFELRWFTPTTEVDLCGHATLATAHVLWNHTGARAERLRFSTRGGDLGVERESDRLVLDFPSRQTVPADVTPDLVAALGRRPAEVLVGRDLLAVFDNKRDVHEIAPDPRLLVRLEGQGVIVTAPAAGHDFVSRYFAPKVGVDEDPVTGSAHCALVPYWAARLGKTTLTAHQVSKRGGELFCELRGTRVRLGGSAVTYLQGTASV